jgi:hypothetical protein
MAAHQQASSSIVVPTDAELLQAQADLWRHSLNYLNSMALKCAVELGIPTAIHRLGGSASTPGLIAALSLPAAKQQFLSRLMRLLASSGVFSVVVDSSSTEAATAYSLTPLSYLLVDGVEADGHINHAPFLLTVTAPHYIDLAMGLADWFKQDVGRAPFDHVHGASLFEESMERKHPEFHKMSIQGLIVHDNFGTDIALREFREIFEGIKSLTDCCYHGDGMTARAIARAFPHIKVTVLDLPQEIRKMPADAAVSYVGGDMFKSIPRAQVVMLKVYTHECSNNFICCKRERRKVDTLIQIFFPRCMHADGAASLE